MTTFAEIYDYCMGKPGAEETFPFDERTLVFKVAGKMFALIDPEGIPPAMNLKCDPERAVALREEYEAVEPGYHMNKTHWNTVTFDGSLPGPLAAELIDHSYGLVVASLPKRLRVELETSVGKG